MEAGKGREIKFGELPSELRIATQEYENFLATAEGHAPRLLATVIFVYEPPAPQGFGTRPEDYDIFVPER